MSSLIGADGQVSVQRGLGRRDFLALRLRPGASFGRALVKDPDVSELRFN